MFFTVMVDFQINPMAEFLTNSNLFFVTIGLKSMKNYLRKIFQKFRKNFKISKKKFFKFWNRKFPRYIFDPKWPRMTLIFGYVVEEYILQECFWNFWISMKFKDFRIFSDLEGFSYNFNITLYCRILYLLVQALVFYNWV